MEEAPRGGGRAGGGGVADGGDGGNAAAARSGAARPRGASSPRSAAGSMARRKPKKPTALPPAGDCASAAPLRRFNYLVVGGNNSVLVRDALARRPWWAALDPAPAKAVEGRRPPVPRQAPPIDPAFNFLWRSGNFVDCRHDEWNRDAARPQMVNHFEFVRPLCALPRRAARSARRRLQRTSPPTAP